jgi:hypothetical protein
MRENISIPVTTVDDGWHHSAGMRPESIYLQAPSAGFFRNEKAE